MTTVAELAGGEVVGDHTFPAGRAKAIREVATLLIGSATVQGLDLPAAKDAAAYDLLLAMGLLGASAQTHQDRLDRAAVRAIIDSLGG